MYLCWLQTHSYKVLVDKVPKRAMFQQFQTGAATLMELWMDPLGSREGFIANWFPCAWPCQAFCSTLNVGMGTPVVWLKHPSAQHLSNIWGCFRVWIPTLRLLIGLLISLSPSQEELGLACPVLGWWDGVRLWEARAGGRVRAGVVQRKGSQMSVVWGWSRWLLPMAQRDPQGENWKRQIYPMGVGWEVETWVEVGGNCGGPRAGAHPEAQSDCSTQPTPEGSFLCKCGCTGGQENIPETSFFNANMFIVKCNALKTH